MEIDWTAGTTEEHLAAIKFCVTVIAKMLCYLVGYCLFKVFKESITTDAKWL